MELDNERESDNVEDRRGGGYGGLPIGGRHIGIGTVVIAVVAGLVFHVNPLTVLSLLSGGPGVAATVPATVPATTPAQPAAAGPDTPEVHFVRKVLASTENVWQAQLPRYGHEYRDPKLVLYRGATPTACGTGQTAMGPFYCPGDEKVYIDLDFYDTLKNQLGAPGDFAQAYVIAHEVGHHVQNILGITQKVDAARSRLSEAQANQLSVRVELQADCLAGVWGYHANADEHILDQGDIEQAINAASKIGDDALQKQSRGVVEPETFTHGTSQQRVNWFNRGAQSGDVRQCDTFNAREL